jgi:hypothetical protein
MVHARVELLTARPTEERRGKAAPLGCAGRR